MSLFQISGYFWFYQENQENWLVFEIYNWKKKLLKIFCSDLNDSVLKVEVDIHES